ncbi:MAG: MmcQ/YjbR family DNA-binding protein [Ignavibacteriae bacterium]|nr:MmcQ/YjbR family DNA-binding protein [Ignavibacteriota bacterium]
MNLEFFREYALKKKAASESQPFGEDVIVYKVAGKIFMMMNFETPFQISLKCDPELAIELREKYSAIRPAYHMNNKHWNMIDADGSVPVNEILNMIDHSYELVVRKLTKKEKEIYKNSR